MTNAFAPIAPVADPSSNPSNAAWFQMDQAPISDRTVLPPGLYHAVFAGATNNGYQESQFGRKKEIALFFSVYAELSEESEIVTLYKLTTVGFNEKSSTYKMAKAICNNKELTGDLSKLVGKPLQLMVTTYTNSKGEEANKIENFLPAQYNIPPKVALVPKYMAAKIEDSIGDYLNIPILSEEDKAKYIKEPKATAPTLQRKFNIDRPVAEPPTRIYKAEGNAATSIRPMDGATTDAISDFLRTSDTF